MIRPLFTEVRNSFTNGITNTYKNISDIRLGLLIGYLLLITLIIICVSQPFLGYVNGIDTNSKKMLALLPLELIMKIKQIYKYLEEKTLNLD